MLRIALIDDCEEDLFSLDKILKDYFQSINRQITTSFYRSPLLFLNHYDSQFDLIFFDIEMEEMSGIELAKLIRQKDEHVRIIFCTSHPKYAVDGYGLNALSFFVKPITKESLSLKMNHILYYIESTDSRKIAFTNRDNIKTFHVDKIKWIDVNDHYVTVHTGGDDYECRASLHSLEKELAKDDFVRCNNYCLVNLAFVTEVTDNQLIIGEKKFNISRPRKQSVLKSVRLYFNKGNNG